LLLFMMTFISHFRVEVIALFMLGLAALAIGIREAPLVDWDEATYAEVAHEAVQTGSYLNFTWNGSPYLKKPPLLFWMMIGSFKTFGESAWAARLPSVATGVGTLLLLYFFAAPISGRLGGIFAGILPLSFYFFIARGGRECATDGPLIFFSTLTLLAFTRGSAHRRWLLVAGLACGLGILSKGLAGFVPLGVVILSLVLVPGFSTIGWKGFAVVSGAALIVTAPWFTYEALVNGPLFWSVFVKHETLLRLASHLEAQKVAADSTFSTFVREVSHLWVLLIPLGGLFAATIGSGSQWSIRKLPPAVLLWILWLMLALAAAGAVQTKLGWYILPALVPVALLGGSILGASFQATGAARSYCPALAALAIAILVGEAPGHWRQIDQAFHTQKDRSRPAYTLGKRAHELGISSGESDLYFVGVELPTLVYYSGMRTHFIESSSGSGFELLDLGISSLLVEDRQVMLLKPDGTTAMVGNLGDEWNFSGPLEERRDTVSAAAESGISVN
jgi:4-amino-4-deoxy-L-arabinose transferase-like glycosyltransferase